jgi:hypothetical protein
MEDGDVDLLFDLNRKTGRVVRLTVTRTSDGQDLDVLHAGLRLPNGRYLEPSFFSRFLGETEDYVVNALGGRDPQMIMYPSPTDSPEIQRLMCALYPGVNVLLERLFVAHMRPRMSTFPNEGGMSNDLADSWMSDPQTSPFPGPPSSVDPAIKAGLYQWMSRFFEDVERRAALRKNLTKN